MYRLEDGLVFDRRGHHTPPAGGTQYAPPAKDREVVGLRSTRREAEFVGRCAEACGDTLTGFVEGGARLAAPAVRARRIAETRIVVGQHRGQHLRTDRRGGGVVEIDRVGHGRQKDNGNVESKGTV